MCTIEDRQGSGGAAPAAKGVLCIGPRRLDGHATGARRFVNAQHEVDRECRHSLKRNAACEKGLRRKVRPQAALSHSRLPTRGSLSERIRAAARLKPEI